MLDGRVRAKIMARFGNDPLYHGVLASKDKDEFQRAMEVLANIRGHNALTVLLECVEEELENAKCERATV